jgi:hypothetical protein
MERSEKPAKKHVVIEEKIDDDTLNQIKYLGGTFEMLAE